MGTTGLSVEPGGQRADGKARISTVQTVGTSISAGEEEELALEAALIGGPTHQVRSSVVRALRTMVCCEIAQDQSVYACQLCARSTSVVDFC